MPESEHETTEAVRAFNEKVVETLKSTSPEEVVEVLRGESSLLRADSNHNHNNNRA